MIKKSFFGRPSILIFLSVLLIVLTGCKSENKSGKKRVELVCYKQEAVDTFKEIEAMFNESHDDIELKIDCPNEAMTILKTRFIREDYPDIIAIGGDVNYSNFLDANLFMDISDLEEIKEVKESYLDIDKQLEYIPKEGVYALPYASNAAGVLYNKEIFDEHGWEIPNTWEEFVSLCEEIKGAGVRPLYFGFKDTWTCLAPWNSLAVGIADPDVCAKVNRGETTFSKEYKDVAEKMKALPNFAEENPYAYGYNDACTSFARGESAMFVIGSYAIPQIKSVNPDMKIDSFTFPANSDEKDNVLNSGIDLQMCLMKDSPNKEAAYEVLKFLYKDEVIKTYLKGQGGLTCKKGDFEIPAELNGMKKYIEGDRMADYHDHQYPSEMAVDAMLQTFLIDDSSDSVDKFLKKFDQEWIRYNRDLIRKISDYEEKKGGKQ